MPVARNGRWMEEEARQLLNKGLLSAAETQPVRLLARRRQTGRPGSGFDLLIAAIAPARLRAAGWLPPATRPTLKAAGCT